MHLDDLLIAHGAGFVGSNPPVRFRQPYPGLVVTLAGGRGYSS
jgi:hypothetical protein